MRKTSNRRRAFGVRGILVEEGSLVHHIVMSRNDGWVISVNFIKDDGPESRRGDLRLLGKHVLLEVILKNASEVHVAVVVDAPK